MEPMVDSASPLDLFTNPLHSIAILSVYDKTGLLDFAKELHALNVRLLGSGGTAKLVRNAGIPIG